MGKKQKPTETPGVTEPLRRIDVWCIILGHRLFLMLGAAWASWLPAPAVDNRWNLWFDGPLATSKVFFPFSNWDGQHYLLLAEKGYAQVHLHHQAFYPFFPWAISALKGVVGEAHLAALLTTFLASVVFARYFWLWCREWLDETRATVALLWAFALPQAFYTGVIYTESLFLAALFAWLYYHRKNSFWQLLPALVMPLIRAHGLFVLVALGAARAVDALRRRQFPQRAELLGALALCLGVAGYFAFMAFSTGSPWSGFRAQATFVSQNQVLNVINPVALIQNITRPTPDWFDVEQGAVDKFTMFIVLIGLWPVWNLRNSLVFFLYLLLAWVPMVMGTGQSFFRYALIALPFLVVAVLKLSPQKRFQWKPAHGLALMASAALQLTVFIRFAQNQWVG